MSDLDLVAVFIISKSLSSSLSFCDRDVEAQEMMLMQTDTKKVDRINRYCLRMIIVNLHKFLELLAMADNVFQPQDFGELNYIEICSFHLVVKD
jgi:hypothetical protein